MIATSTPSSEMPLIKPIARRIVVIAISPIVGPELSPGSDCATRPATSEGPVPTLAESRYIAHDVCTCHRSTILRPNDSVFSDGRYQPDRPSRIPGKIMTQPRSAFL